jgi:hypothetical protein
MKVTADNPSAEAPRETGPQVASVPPPDPWTIAAAHLLLCIGFIPEEMTAVGWHDEAKAMAALDAAGGSR